MNKITLDQATAIVGASLADGWMEAANQMIDKVKQPEPVQPHAELKAMYEQQVKDGTLKDFIWEYKCTEKNEEFSLIKIGLGKFYLDCEYRCIPKPTCQVRNDDTRELKTLTREAAQELQAELSDAVEWCIELQTPRPKTVPWYPLGFDQTGVYTYKLKANLVKLDGELMTREAAHAKWERLKPTHDLWFGHIEGETIPSHQTTLSQGFETGWFYELREKPTVKLTIDDEPAKMLTPAQCEAERLARVDTHDVESRSNFEHCQIFEKDDTANWFAFDCNGAEYRLIRKQPKQEWTGSREDVIALLNELGVTK